MAPFEAKGDVPLWQVIYDHAVRLKPGDLISFAKLTKLLGYDPSRPGASRGPILTAARRMLREHDRTLISVRGEGYRVALPAEHEGIGRATQRSARRKIRRGVEVTTHVDRNALTSAQQQSLDALAHVLSAQNAMLKRHDVQIRQVAADNTQQDARLDVLEATLRKHGIEIPEVRTIEGETA